MHLLEFFARFNFSISVMFIPKLTRCMRSKEVEGHSIFQFAQVAVFLMNKNTLLCSVCILQLLIKIPIKEKII